ncbi:unnamed protein product [Moneuplotes crassus]|uniref:Uncharacterized protein n=1 Tax=Euplotes crassus TaxID=5936 RepID=A0AAD1Y6B8_EUPCR|nr:unnamed protein product [Moneuplotes crassus]
MNSKPRNQSFYGSEMSSYPYILQDAYQEQPRIAHPEIFTKSALANFCCLKYETGHIAIPQESTHQVFYCDIDDFCLCGTTLLQTPRVISDEQPQIRDQKEFSPAVIARSFTNYSMGSLSYLPHSESSSVETGIQRQSDDFFSPSWVRAQYKSRKDVIYKAIFRRMRKFFMDDFLTTMGKKSIKSRFPQKVKDYCSFRFPACENETVSVIFNCIINSKEKICKIRSRDQPLRKKVSELVYMFSERRLKEMEEHPEFFEILMYFLNQPNTLNLISEDGTQEYLQKLRECLEQLAIVAAYRRSRLNL